MPAQHLGPHRALDGGLDAFDELVAGVDVHAGVAISGGLRARPSCAPGGAAPGAARGCGILHARRRRRTSANACQDRTNADCRTRRRRRPPVAARRCLLLAAATARRCRGGRARSTRWSVPLHGTTRGGPQRRASARRCASWSCAPRDGGMRPTNARSIAARGRRPGSLRPAVLDDARPDAQGRASTARRSTAACRRPACRCGRPSGHDTVVLLRADRGRRPRAVLASERSCRSAARSSSAALARGVPLAWPQPRLDRAGGHARRSAWSARRARALGRQAVLLGGSARAGSVDWTFGARRRPCARVAGRRPTARTSRRTRSPRATRRRHPRPRRPSTCESVASRTLQAYAGLIAVTWSP